MTQTNLVQIEEVACALIVNNPKKCVKFKKYFCLLLAFSESCTIFCDKKKPSITVAQRKQSSKRQRCCYWATWFLANVLVTRITESRKLAVYQAIVF